MKRLRPGRPGASRGSSAFPKIRFVALLENGTHVLWAARMSKYRTDEITLARDVVPALRKGMLCLADRFFPGDQLRRMAVQQRDARVFAVAHPPECASGRGSTFARRLLSQSHLHFHWTLLKSAQWNRGPRDRLSFEGRQRRGADLPVDHHHPGRRPSPGPRTGGPLPRARGIETALDELKTHLRGAQIVLRSKTPESVKQEFWGLLWPTTLSRPDA